MGTGFARLAMGCGAICVLEAGAAWGIPTVSLVAVKLNEVPIEPTSLIVAEPGDTIEAEIVISNWADDLPSGVRSYSVRLLAGEGATSGANGMVLPLGWEAPLEQVPCGPDNECSSGYLCSGFCHGPAHNPSLGAYIIVADPEFILGGYPTIADVAVTLLDNYLYFGHILDEEGVLDPLEPRYGGTVILVVSEFACGTFVYEVEVCGDTYLSSPEAVKVDPGTEPLIIEVGTCSILPTLSLPQTCAVDARIPHYPNSAGVDLGWSSIDITFDGSPAGLGASSFSTRLVPAGVAPAVTNVMDVGGNTLRLVWDSVIPPEYWTCVRHLESGREMCLGNLPANSDQGLASEPQDIEALVMTLEGRSNLPPMESFQCDVDRSNRCSPLDILSGIDLLNGAGYEVWAGANLVDVCPSGPLVAPTVAGTVDLGACCDKFAGVCRDDVAHEDCPEPRYEWTFRGDCCIIVDCDARGACCDTFAGECEDGVLEIDCQGSRRLWFKWMTCGSVACIPRGACCNTALGWCSDEVLERDCAAPGLHWIEATRCSEIFCVPQ